MAGKNSVDVPMETSKIHKGSISFEQILSDPMDEELLGRFYVPKPTLKLIGYSMGDEIVVTITKK